MEDQEANDIGKISLNTKFSSYDLTTYFHITQALRKFSIYQSTPTIIKIYSINKDLTRQNLCNPNDEYTSHHLKSFEFLNHLEV